MAGNPIEGKVFCVAGIVTHYHSHDEAHAAIKAAGGKISKSIGARTDVLVLGTNTWTQEQKAKSRGVPIITEQQLVHLLAGGNVNIERKAEKVGSASLEKLIGEARATLDGHPGQRMWEKLLALVDSCAPDELPALVDFLEPQVARWEFPYSTSWSTGRSTHGCGDAPGRWSQFMPLGELRVAPHSWTVDMAAGKDSPKFRLVHAIHTRDMELNGTMLAKILGCANLTNLRDFDVDENKVSKTLFKKLRTVPSTRTLERFRFSRIDAKSVGGIDGEHHLENLRALAVRMDFATKEEALHDFMRADAFARIEDFEIHPYYIAQAMRGFTGPEVFPNLKSLTLITGQKDEIASALTHPVIGRLERVRIDVYWNVVAGSFGDLTANATALRHLDLSILGLFHGQGPERPEQAAEFADAMRSWTPPECLETLTLGRWHTDELAAELAETHGLTVVR